MAKVVSAKDAPPPRPRRAQYPWEQWFDGRMWELKYGEDFQVAVHVMAVTVYAAARRKGLRVSVHEVGTQIIRLQVTGKVPALMQLERKIEKLKKPRTSSRGQKQNKPSRHRVRTAKTAAVKQAS
jgi:hypothetical protein